MNRKITRARRQSTPFNTMNPCGGSGRVLCEVRPQERPRIETEEKALPAPNQGGKEDEERVGIDYLRID